MQGVVEVHACQHRKDVSLQESDQKFETGQSDRHDERKDRTADPERAERAERGDEPGKDFHMLAEDIAKQQLGLIEEKLEQLIHLYDMTKDIEIIGAGTGRMLAAKIANNKGYAYTDMENLWGFTTRDFSGMADCAAAFAVAELARIK